MSDPLILEHHDLVSVLTLNNPPAHTWTPESLQQLQQIVADLNSNANNRALVVTGAGDMLDKIRNLYHDLPVLICSVFTIVMPLKLQTFPPPLVTRFRH